MRETSGLATTGNPRQVVRKGLTTILLQPIPDVRRERLSLGRKLGQQVLEPPVTRLPTAAVVVITRPKRFINRQEDELPIPLGRHHLARIAIGLDRIPCRGIGRLLDLTIRLGHLQRPLHIPRSFRMRAAIFDEYEFALSWRV